MGGYMQPYFGQEYLMQLAASYPVFVRRAVESEEEGEEEVRVGECGEGGALGERND